MARVVLRSMNRGMGGRARSGKGLILNNDPVAVGSTPTATVEISASIFISEEFFAPGDVNPQTRLKFPFVDITSKLRTYLVTNLIYIWFETNLYKL